MAGRWPAAGFYHRGMAYDEVLAGRVRDCLRDVAGVAERANHSPQNDPASPTPRKYAAACAGSRRM
jgi:hypothetical protein